MRARNAYETATPSNSASLDFRIPDHIDHELVSVEVCTGINRSGCTAVQPGGTMTVAGDQWHLWIEIAGMLTIDEAPAPGIRVTTFTNITRPCGNGCTSTTIAQQLHDTGANGTYASHITWTRTQNGCESVLIRSAGHYAGFSSPTKVLGFTMCS